jgi:hypothetical protein
MDVVDEVLLAATEMQAWQFFADCIDATRGVNGIALVPVKRYRLPMVRPEIGQPINVRLGDGLLTAIDARADRMGYSRAEVIRMLLADAMQAEMEADR